MCIFAAGFSLPPSRGPHPVVDARLSDFAQQGIGLCRQGDWARGLSILKRVGESERNGSLPSLFYSYLGFGIAKFDRRTSEGLTLCRHALKKEFYQPENYVHLARTLLLTGDRKGAVATLERGLRLLPGHVELERLRIEMGRRRRPVVRFLSRHNILNLILGRIRAAVLPAPPVETKPAVRLALRRSEELL